MSEGARVGSRQVLFAAYLDAVLNANRAEARRHAAAALSREERAEEVYDWLLWPIIDELHHRLRVEAIDLATHELAIRIHRQVSDQVAAHLSVASPHGKRVVLTCGAGEPEELAAQLVADRFEAAGWCVWFLGGGVPNDEIVHLVGRVRPQVVVVFASRPGELPGVRQLIHEVHAANASPGMNVVVGGGVFNRAQGLAQEIGADLSAPTIRGVLEAATGAPPREGGRKPPGKRRHVRRSEFDPVTSLAIRQN